MFADAPSGHALSRLVLGPGSREAVHAHRLGITSRHQIHEMCARAAEISRGANRKSLAAVPAALAGNLPVVDTVSPETVAAVLRARAEMPEATQAELQQHTGISDRTIRKVLKAVPAEIAGEVLELTDGRAA